MPAIILNPDNQNGLELKVLEYKRRLEGQKEKADANIPEELVGLGTKAKIYVAEKLLKDGQFDFDAVVKEVGRKFGIEETMNAMVVVAEYNRNGGKRLSGGTGFPPQ